MKRLSLSRHTVSISAAAALLAACSALQPLAATPSPEPPPTYVALHAGTPGQPKLNAAEMAQVRKILAEVKPCQRPLLRYVFDGDSVAIFFAPQKTGLSGVIAPFVFGSHNEVYLPEDGSIIPTMDDVTDAQIIKYQKCPP
jgi:hypothetical protein